MLVHVVGVFRFFLFCFLHRDWPNEVVQILGGELLLRIWSAGRNHRQCHCTGRDRVRLVQCLRKVNYIHSQRGGRVCRATDVSCSRAIHYCLLLKVKEGFPKKIILKQDTEKVLVDVIGAGLCGLPLV